MYIRKAWSTYKGKKYYNYVLVESVQTEKGPRQKTICCLGDLQPRPAEEWLILAHKVEDALAEGLLFEEGTDKEVLDIVKKVKERKEAIPDRPRKKSSDDVISVQTNKVETEEIREAGTVHVGYQFWKRLEMKEILEEIGLGERARNLACAMTMNRLVHPGSEHAMPDWIRSTALEDMLGISAATLVDETLYRMLDLLHPHREKIEQALAERERSLFGLDNTILFYDLTSTYFEGEALKNPKAQRGYSRDKRFDCKQVVVGLIIGREGFPVAHEVFKGNQNDAPSLPIMLDLLDNRVGLQEGQTVVIDRGMSSAENLEELKRRNLHYIVASRQEERYQLWDAFEDHLGFTAVYPEECPEGAKVKKVESGGILYVLCESPARKEKDRAIRQRQENNFLKDITKLGKRIETGKMKKQEDIQQAIGRLRERYPRICRYYEIQYEPETKKLSCMVRKEKLERAEQLDGCYLLKTDRTDLDSKEVWRTYMLLTRAESAFRSMKSPLAERPIFHQLQRRVETHIFLCVLAYHILVAIEKTLQDKGEHTSWATVRNTLKTHQVATVVLPTDGDMTLKIRKGSVPEPQHTRLYELLGVPKEIMKPKKMWVSNSLI